MSVLFGVLVMVLTFVTLATSTKIPVDRGTQRFIVKLHNSYRGKVSPPAANMQAMKWDQSLSNKAASWVRRCVFEHQMNGPGENLAYDTNRKNNKDLIRSAMKRFYDEYKLYTYGQHSCGKACHYTQMVWATTTRVGCAMERCPSMSAFGRRVSNAWYFACFYEPMGNMNGQKPYISGTPCSQCLQGQTCSKNVCRGKGREKCQDNNTKCKVWTERNECTRNPRYMSINCRLSCGKCAGRGSGGGSNGGTNSDNDNNTGDSGTQIGEQCRDDDRRCKSWSTRGECRKNPRWMLAHCKKSCGQCGDQTGPPCTDKLQCCAEMRRKGHCLVYGDYMGEFCQKTCAMCPRRG